MTDGTKTVLVLTSPAGLTCVHINVHPLFHCIEDERRQTAFSLTLRDYRGTSRLTACI